LRKNMFENVERAIFLSLYLNPRLSPCAAKTLQKSRIENEQNKYFYRLIFMKNTNTDCPFNVLFYMRL